MLLKVLGPSVKIKDLTITQIFELTHKNMDSPERPTSQAPSSPPLSRQNQAVFSDSAHYADRTTNMGLFDRTPQHLLADLDIESGAGEDDDSSEEEARPK